MTTYIEVGKVTKGQNKGEIFIASSKERHEEVQTALTKQTKHILLFQKKDIPWLIEALQKEMK